MDPNKDTEGNILGVEDFAIRQSMTVAMHPFHFLHHAWPHMVQTAIKQKGAFSELRIRREN